MAFTKRPYNRTSQVNSVSVGAGATEVVKLPPAEKYSIFVYPGSGATVSISVIGSKDALIDADTYESQAWSEGDVTTDTHKVLDGPLTGLELASTVATSVVEIVTI